MGVSLLVSIPSTDTCAPDGIDVTSNSASCARTLLHVPAKTMKNKTEHTLTVCFAFPIELAAPFPAETYFEDSMQYRQDIRARDSPNLVIFS
jgi:hypothetical protein